MSAVDLAIAVLKSTPAVIQRTTLSRIYPVVAPENSLTPYAVVSLISDNDEQMLAGKAGMYTARIQVDCMASNATDAAALALAVDSALEERKDSYPNKLVDCFRDGIAFSDYSDDRTICRYVRGFYIHWRK